LHADPGQSWVPVDRKLRTCFTFGFQSDQLDAIFAKESHNVEPFMANIENFGARLRALRSERLLSKSALARTVGVSPTCVWNWEEGNTHPRADALSRLAAALSTTREVLERGVEPREMFMEARPTLSETLKPTNDLLSGVIRRAREEIAAAAGVSVERVKVLLEYGA
jgi:transcriptional regulator with XRE-family HTH domain